MFSIRICDPNVTQNIVYLIKSTKLMLPAVKFLTNVINAANVDDFKGLI